MANVRHLPNILWIVAALAAVCLLVAPHVPVTREAHCGLLITMHMMEVSWTLIFTVGATAGLAALVYDWPHIAVAIGVATGAYALFLMSQIRSWYSYQTVPDDLDVMGRVFGHVLDIGLPLALAGSILMVLVAIALPDRTATAKLTAVA